VGVSLAMTNLFWLNLSDVLANPFVAFGLRAALGLYVVWMARGFYADPLGYFRKWMPAMEEQPWMAPMVRGAAVFCVWGGCFIVGTAIATQIFGLHGWALAALLVLLAVIAAYFLLPGTGTPTAASSSEDDSMRRLK
jgi:hypothetical protein